MTNPRHMLLSLGAMLFTLAVGIGVGAGPLQGGSDDRLRAEVDELEQDNSELADQVRTAGVATDHAETFASTVEPELVASTLAERHVVLVALPGTNPEQHDEVRQTLESAQATVTGLVEIDAQWAAPGQQQFLEDLTSRLVTEDTALPADGTAYDRAGALLARALVTSETDDVGMPDNQTTAILGGLGAGELLDVGDEELARAELAVVLAPPSPQDVDGAEGDGAVDAQTAAWTAVARSLSNVGTGVVVTGEPQAAREDGLLGSLRLDGVVREEVSTVDMVDTAPGRVGVVYALAEQAAGESGHYGMVDPVDAVVAEPPAADGSSDSPDEEGNPDAADPQPDAGR